MLDRRYEHGSYLVFEKNCSNICVLKRITMRKKMVKEGR